MNTINLTTELSQEDRERIDDLTSAVSLLASVLIRFLPKAENEKVIEKVTDGTQPVQKLSDCADSPDTDNPPIEVPNESEAYVKDLAPAEEVPTPKVKPVSLAEFQKAITMAVSKGADAKKATKTIINKYAESVSAVPEDKRADVMAELATI